MWEILIANTELKTLTQEIYPNRKDIIQNVPVSTGCWMKFPKRSQKMAFIIKGILRSALS